MQGWREVRGESSETKVVQTPHSVARFVRQYDSLGDYQLPATHFPNEKEKPIMERVWWSTIANADQLQEAICFLRGLSEEVILSHGKLKIELLVEKRLPQAADDFPGTITRAAGETH